MGYEVACTAQATEQADHMLYCHYDLNDDGTIKTVWLYSGISMTDKELRRLNRGELLEMLLEQSRENDRLRERLGEMQSAREEQSAQMRKLS